MMVLSILVFASVGIAVVVFSDAYMRSVLDESQHALYEERIDNILVFLERQNARLAETEMVDAYRQGFMDSALRSLKDAFYHEGNTVYPFIQGLDGSSVLHPVEPLGSMKYAHLPFVQKAIRLKTGEFEYDSVYGDRKWAVFKEFEPWGWVVGYAIPLKVKYADAMVFRTKLVGMLASVFIIAIALMVFVSWRMTRPLGQLIDVSEAMKNGDLGQPVNVVGSGEVGVLARRFASMSLAVSEKVQALEEERRKLKNEVQERERAQQEMASLRTFMKELIDSIPSAFISVDVEGKVTLWNLAAERYLGIDEKDVLGRSLQVVAPILAKEVSQFPLDSMGPVSVVSSRIREGEPNGGETFELLVIPLLESTATGTLIRIDDITERRVIEERMVQTEKMMSVGGLAVGMAHEINNPLGGILQGVQNIERRLSDALPGNVHLAESLGVELEVVRSYLEKRQVLYMLEGIRDSGLRAARIISNVMDFSHPREVKHYPVNLERIVASALELADSEYDMRKSYDFRKIRVIKNYAKGMPLVSCGWSEVEQVLLNVFRNAAQAMVSFTDDPVITVSISAEKGEAVIDIEDNGPGMAEDVRKRIFEPFYTTKDPDIGSGLGLSVSYFIITQNHNGHFQVFSEPGAGTRFSIRLPVE